AEEEIISEILYKYGNEKKSRKIANQIIQSRSKAEIKTTLELASIIQSVFPDKKFKINPATKSFQAFRIFINDELKELQDGLIKASKILNKGGLIVIISFHSLE
ncbi:MAG: 16S rRNA (cytosine(1402)-N(4))-methyltransferase, partial [Gammaproteobacteria bacterium]